MPMMTDARKELIEARNAADNSVYTAEKVLRDLGDKVPGDLKSKVEDQVAKVRQVMDSEDVETIRKETEALNQIVSADRCGCLPAEPRPPARAARGERPIPRRAARSRRWRAIVDGMNRSLRSP